MDLDGQQASDPNKELPNRFSFEIGAHHSLNDASRSFINGI
jgi:hypothetical protein